LARSAYNFKAAGLKVSRAGKKAARSDEEDEDEDEDEEEEEEEKED
jgi:hypothetical protein